jgi:MFS family permease
VERNLRLYPAYQACRHLLFWLPVFYLYFASVLPGAQALLLEALYFGGVVLLEVPSGYLSDRFGRRPTLILAMLASATGCLLFVCTSSFASFAVAQLCFAAGMAFNSGTDSALLYDSLATLDRGGEVAVREGEAQRLAFATLALASFTGGLLAGVDLRLAYGLSGLGALAGLGVALRFQEPPRTGPPAAEPVQQLRDCVGQLKHPVLGWTFLYAVGMTVFDHVPYELFQPYLELLFARHDLGGYAVTPPISGTLVAVMMLVASWFSGQAVWVGRRLGLIQALVLTVALQGIVITVMAIWLHPLVAALMIFRNVPAALRRPLLAGAIQPRLRSGLRATYFSMQSLAGRLAFSGALALASWSVLGTAGELDAGSLAALLRIFGVAALAQLLLLTLTGFPVVQRLREARIEP